jgi:hypothetical protein
VSDVVTSDKQLGCAAAGFFDFSVVLQAAAFVNLRLHLQMPVVFCCSVLGIRHDMCSPELCGKLEPQIIGIPFNLNLSPPPAGDFGHGLLMMMFAAYLLSNLASVGTPNVMCIPSLSLCSPSPLQATLATGC